MCSATVVWLTPGEDLQRGGEPRHPQAEGIPVALFEFTVVHEGEVPIRPAPHGDVHLGEQHPFDVGFGWEHPREPQHRGGLAPERERGDGPQPEPRA